MCDIMTNYIYLLQEREFIKTKEPIYKVGMTKKENHERFNQYPKGSVLLFQMICDDCKNIEKHVINIFKEKCIQRKDIGNEYFEGDYIIMIDNIYLTIKNETKIHFVEPNVSETFKEEEDEYVGNEYFEGDYTNVIDRLYLTIKNKTNISRVEPDDYLISKIEVDDCVGDALTKFLQVVKGKKYQDEAFKIICEKINKVFPDYNNDIIFGGTKKFIKINIISSDYVVSYINPQLNSLTNEKEFIYLIDYREKHSMKCDGIIYLKNNNIICKDSIPHFLEKYKEYYLEPNFKNAINAQNIKRNIIYDIYAPCFIEQISYTKIQININNYKHDTINDTETITEHIKHVKSKKYQDEAFKITCEKINNVFPEYKQDITFGGIHKFININWCRGEFLMNETPGLIVSYINPQLKSFMYRKDGYPYKYVGYYDNFTEDEREILNFKIICKDNITQYIEKYSYLHKYLTKDLEYNLRMTLSNNEIYHLFPIETYNSKIKINIENYEDFIKTQAIVHELSELNIIDSICCTYGSNVVINNKLFAIFQLYYENNRHSGRKDQFSEFKKIKDFEIVSLYLFISGNLKRYNIYRHNKKYYFEM
jgi:hypothetical protein